MKCQFISISLVIFLYNAIDVQSEDKSVCAMDQCDENIDWEKDDFSAQFRSWLAQERSKTKVVFCKDEAERRPLSESATRLYRYERCAFIDYWVNYQYQGKRDKERNMFKGKGTLTFIPHDLSSGYQRQSNTKQIGVSDQEFCIIDNAFMSLQSIVGQFKSGLPHGEVQIKHHNFANMKGHAVEGVLHGKVVMRNKNGALTFIGRYKDGVPDGWCWIFSPDDPNQQLGALYVRFEHGSLLTSQAVLVDFTKARAWIGEYSDGILTNAKMFKVKEYTDVGCVRRIRIPQKIESKNNKKEVQLPVKIKLTGGRLSIVSNRLLMFNRIAKVGSQSLIKLMVELGKINGYNIQVDQRTEEIYNVAPWEQLQMAETISANSDPSVWVRHFNFLDFDALGLAPPTWINIVRDPVERVISNFYYRRAGWNIVERKLAFPDEPLPDPAFLRRDFETCVLEGDPECSYIENNLDTRWETGDHRRQMMQFCGQQAVCARFNNEEAMEMAKINVDKHYAVVGVLEMWDNTLEVLENKLPFFFKGARKMYDKKFKEVRRMAQNFHKGFVSEEIKNIVRQNFSREIEFYQFCKQRLQVQLDDIRGKQLE